MMSDVNKEYGKELGRFEFDGSYLNQNAGSFIVYEKGLLINLASLNPVFTKWSEMAHVTLSSGETTKVIIELENEDGEIIAESKNRPGDVTEFYDLVSRQKEKYWYYDSFKEIELDLEDISIMMETDRWVHEPYLDTKTGKIILIPEELDEDNIYDDEYISRLPEWQKKMVEEVKAVYEDEEERYEIIPERTSRDAYEIMVEFAKTLDDPGISEKLFDALDGKGAFRRFKDVVKKYPQIEEQWYKFKNELEKQEVREWLWSIGIDPVDTNHGDSPRGYPWLFKTLLPTPSENEGGVF